MKSDLLDQETVEEAIKCLRVAAGEVEHTLDILETKVSAEDLATYKRMVGKVIIAIYSGLADPIMEGFPEMRKALYEEHGDDSQGAPST